MDAMNPAAARVARVNGPLVEVTGLAGAAMYDVVELGEHRLPGEIVAIRGDVATVQAYEYTGGLAPGHPAWSRGEPLSARLGPHLLGGIFDGLLRPLERGTRLARTRLLLRRRRRPEYEFTPETRDRSRPRRGRQPGGGGGSRRYRVPGAGAARAAVAWTGRRGGEGTRGRARTRRRGDRDRGGHGRAHDVVLAGAAAAPVPAPARRGPAAADRAARGRRAVPGGQGRQLRRARGVRHRQDRAAAADHEVVRRGRDRVRRLRRARQRARRHAHRTGRTRRSAQRRAS